jgi:hypothetical protein
MNNAFDDIARFFGSASSGVSASPVRITPAMRAIAAAAVTAAALYAIKPLTFFTELGEARVASWAARDDQKESAVLVPWWGVVLAVAVAVDLFL